MTAHRACEQASLHCDALNITIIRMRVRHLFVIHIPSTFSVITAWELELTRAQLREADRAFAAALVSHDLLLQ